jgi:hypothetical protein
MMKLIRNSLLAIAAVAGVWLSSSCGPNERIMRSAEETPTPFATPADTSPANSGQREFDAMLTAGFSFVYVLKRKDGEPLDATDRSVIREQTASANRRVSADDGRTVVIGTNSELTTATMVAIYERFTVEHYSRPVPAVPVGENDKPDTQK